MGCINSKNELDIHPNIYRVVNVDEEGFRRWSGQLEIAPKELTLYRKGKEPTKWSLQHLRRYGFDADLFTFEAGRRSTTGEGIYAFRCRRAESLFHLLQSYINQGVSSDNDGMGQNSNDTLNSRSGGRVPVYRTGGLNGQQQSAQNDNYVIPSGRQGSIDTLNGIGIDGNYMEPSPAAIQNARQPYGIRLNSFESSNGPLSPIGDDIDELNSPGSPNSFNMILEVTQLNEAHTNQTSHYQNSNLYQEFPLRTIENNNNSTNILSKKLSLDIPPQEQAPTASIPTAISCNSIIGHPSRISGLAKTFQQDSPLNCKIASNNDIITSPTSSAPPIPTSSTVDSMESSGHMYVNITPGEIDGIIGTPNTTQINTFTLPRLSSTYTFDAASRCYENLELGDFRPTNATTTANVIAGRSLHHRYSKPDIFTNIESLSGNNDKSEPCTPTTGTVAGSIIASSSNILTNDAKNNEVNYIVLDLDPSPNNANTSHTGNSSVTIPNTTSHSSTTRITSSKIIEYVTSPTSKISTNNNISKDKLTISNSRSGGGISNLLSPDSPKKCASSAFGYATIDFNKTVALSNSIVPIADDNCEGSRRTRHSSSARHSNSISD